MTIKHNRATAIIKPEAYEKNVKAWVCACFCAGFDIRVDVGSSLLVLLQHARGIEEW